jgi:hypothetical protein
MPKIQWTDLPEALRNQLFERLRERKITVEDLYQLKLWRESDPETPDGLWYKDLAPSRFTSTSSRESPLANHAFLDSTKNCELTTRPQRTAMCYALRPE